MNYEIMDVIILAAVTFLPTAGAIFLLFFPRRDSSIRPFALIVSLITFVLSLYLPIHFNYSQPGFQFDIDGQWISTPNIHFHLGIDGISLWLVIQIGRAHV